MHKKVNWIKKLCSMRVLFAESVQKMYKSDKYLHVVATTCRKLGSRTTNPCNTKNLFPEHSSHINFRKSHEISAKLNDLVKSYHKKTNRRGVGRRQRKMNWLPLPLLLHLPSSANKVNFSSNLFFVILITL